MKTISDKEHNMDDKKVAVLLSTYNGEKYLREQLDSIENQTYKNIQIVIRDDGSHDNTVEIINEYSKKYGNVKFIYGKNKGFIKSFFKLLEYSDADYFAYADQDDIWLPEKIELAVDKLNKFDNKLPNMAFSNSDYYDENMNLIGEGEKHKTYSYTNSLYECVTQGMTMVINDTTRRMILDNPPKKVLFHDWWTYMICASMGNIGYSDETTVKYRRLGNNVTAEGENFIKVFLWRLKNIFGNDGLRNIRLQQREFKRLFYDKLSEQDKKITDIFVRKYTLGGALKKTFYCHKIRRHIGNDIVIRIMFVLGML